MIIFLAFAEGIQLVPDGTIILHILFILIMVVVLNRIFFRPISDVISARESRNRKNLQHAAEIENGIESGNRKYRDALREARASGYKVMEEIRSEGLRERTARIESLKSEIEKRVTTAGAMIQDQAEYARGKLDTATMATSIRDQILEKPDTSQRAN